MESQTYSEKKDYHEAVSSAIPVPIHDGTREYKGEDSVEGGVFAAGPDGVDFRTVGWKRASFFFLKMTFAAGVLSIPASLYTLGAVLGSLFIAFWGILNTYMALLQGQFRKAHPSVHTVADMGYILGLQWGKTERAAKICREILGALYLISWILCSGVSMLGFTTALNAVSEHATCTVVFGFVSFFVISAVGSFRKISSLGIISWTGFISMFTAIMIVTVAVGLRDRPYAAPQTGDFELGYNIAPPAGTTFAGAWGAALAIFSSTANTSGFVPVISEMRRPQDYPKSILCTMTLISSLYMAIANVVYYYCGQWVTSPALGSAGLTIQKISYGIAIPGLIAGAAICVHVAGKYLFVRILRDSPHLTSNSKIHWITWLGSTFGIGLVSWILAEAVPFFGSLVSLIGAVGFGPLGVMLPALLWFSLNPAAWKERPLLAVLHICVFLLGSLITVGGMYANIVNIRAQYAAGTVGHPFSCADNSGSTAGGQ